MKTCLVVDDSKVVRIVARKILEELGFSVVEAEGGQVALDKSTDSTPDVVLLDWNMPVMSGIEYLRALRVTEEGKKPVSRRLFICLCCAILGCFYSVKLLPLNLYAEMLLGCSLIAFYFLPLKIVRRLLDRILIVRWVFLSTLIGGAGVLIGGSGEQISAKLPLLIPMICGNLVVCDKLRHTCVDFCKPCLVE